MVVRVDEVLTMEKKFKNKKRKLEVDDKNSTDRDGTSGGQSAGQQGQLNIVDGMSTSEVTMIRRLAGNDPIIRKKTMRKLRKWLTAITQRLPDTAEGRNDIEHNVIRVWKALFYCMWMADKPLPQEQLAEQISDLVNIFASKQNAFLVFVEWFLRTMAREWNWIDRLRLDKFMMLFRRFIRKSMQALSQRKWKSDILDAFLKIIRIYVFNHYPETKNKKGNHNIEAHVNCPAGLQIHLIDIYLEEVAKVDADGLKSPKIIKLLLPFIEEMALSDDERIHDEIKEKVFYYLMRQSDVGIDYQESLLYGNATEDSSENESEPNTLNDDEDATNGIENMQEEGDDEVFETDNNRPLDPRAGAVDVVLPQLQIDYRILADKLTEAGGSKTIKKRNRGKLYCLASQFRELDQGKYPLALPEEESWKPAIPKKELKKATSRLVELETPEGTKRRKTKKQRRREAKKAAAIEILNDTLGSEDASAYLNDDALLDHVSDNYASYVHEQMEKNSNIDFEADEVLSIDEEEVSSPKKAKKLKKLENKQSNSAKKYKTVIEVEVDDDESFENSIDKNDHIDGSTNLDATIGDDDVDDIICLSVSKSKKKSSRDSLTQIKKTTPMKAKHMSPATPKIKINNTDINLENIKSTILGISTPKTPTSTSKLKKSKLETPNSQSVNKRVSFILARNSEHEATDYMNSISKSPAIPFDGSKNPSFGLLKPKVSTPKRFSTPSGSNPRKRALDFF